MANNKIISKYTKRNHYNLMLPPIPERWPVYKPFGRVVEGTRIICFKVPIREKYQVNNEEIQQIWDIRTLLQSIPKLSAVIDLTNTNRYYKPGELKIHGIAYKKIFVQGQCIPSEEKVKRFIDTVDSFSDKNSLIGVHCTHGLNRTGYMVCRYLRDRCHIPAKDAIKRFEKARGHRIERENYILDLLGKVIIPSEDKLGGDFSDSETAPKVIREKKLSKKKKCVKKDKSD